MMADVRVSIGGREFDVSCQPGEEHFLRSAAKLLDNEATVLLGQIGRLPEARMLLMAGLMLADKTAGLEDQLRAVEERAALAERVAASARVQPVPDPVQVQVPVLPASVLDSFAEIAARAEALADRIEDRVA